MDHHVHYDLTPHAVFCCLSGTTCPAGMIYDPCGSACQSTCAGATAGDCKFLCEEVCRCPNGLVLNGDQCVSQAECGCKLESGGYIQVQFF